MLSTLNSIAIEFYSIYLRILMHLWSISKLLASIFYPYFLTMTKCASNKCLYNLFRNLSVTLVVRTKEVFYRVLSWGRFSKLMGYFSIPCPIDSDGLSKNRSDATLSLFACWWSELFLLRWRDEILGVLRAYYSNNIDRVFYFEVEWGKLRAASLYSSNSFISSRYWGISS